MAEPLPDSLKKPEISRFINRANQVRKFKPAIAYWCEYHAVNQIVGKGLHTGDDAVFGYTKNLLERLEETKSQHADDDAIMDNTAGQAYVEQFAQETFDRAEKVLRADKVTRQTADTFDAAATFFDLTHEWGTPDAETLQKIKFAKWNAARIVRAVREGKDPNESNPKLPEPEQEPQVNLEEELEEVVPKPVQVEDIPDAGEPAPRSVSAAEPSPPIDGYFPSTEPFVPSPMSHSPTATAPGSIPPPLEAPSVETPSIEQPTVTSTPPVVAPPPHIPPVQSPYTPEPGYSPNPSAPPSWTTTPSVPHHASSNPPPFVAPVAPQSFAPPPAPAPVPVPTVPVRTGGYTSNSKDIMQAQKHAKWAISALNFEDVPTAVTELRNALAMLNAQ